MSVYWGPYYIKYYIGITQVYETWPPTSRALHSNCEDEKYTHYRLRQCVLSIMLVGTKVGANIKAKRASAVRCPQWKRVIWNSLLDEMGGWFLWIEEHGERFGKRGDDSRKGLDVGKYRIYSGHGEWHQFIQRRGLEESGHVLAYWSWMRLWGVGPRMRSQVGGSRIAWSNCPQEDEYVGEVGTRWE